MNTEKSELRHALKQARLQMSDADYTLKSRAIVEHLKTVADWSKIGSLHFYEPIRELLEVDILDFITYLQDNYPQIKLATSRKIGSTWELVSLTNQAPPQQYDVIVIPMLGFDAHLHRMGYGGGYYDRFLATQPKARKIGVCFEAGKVATIPAEPHDIPLDQIITEKASY